MRFIPACAGNRSASRVTAERAPVHPRVCGEQLRDRGGVRYTAGSSPRVRGTGQRARSVPALRRFIPACAGNRGGHKCDLRRDPVHPRVCGEQAATFAYKLELVGSSPRVRGTVLGRLRAVPPRRFIPACAGNSIVSAFAHCEKPVHPRVCGEQTGSHILLVAYGGSSPRVRGTGSGCRHIGRIGRFIPACAGNSYTEYTVTIPLTVHPRVCGEQEFRVRGKVTEGGSSPRVRGTATLDATNGSGQRFIPACAGNS